MTIHNDQHVRDFIAALDQIMYRLKQQQWAQGLQNAAPSYYYSIIGTAGSGLGNTWSIPTGNTYPIIK